MKNSNESGRRSFLKKSILAAMGVGAINTLKLESLAASEAVQFKEFEPAAGVFELPPLGYEFNALEPFIDATTMQIHHDKHHQTYVTKLNEALEKAPELKGRTLVELITDISQLPESVRNAIRNHGGGHFNHSLFWKLMSPKAAESKMSDELLTAIAKKWSTIDQLKAEFNTAATSVFGSGWAWLIKDKTNNLSIVTSANQDNPLMDISEMRGKPIMGIDVWEHAYYLKHQNKRADYITDFWNVIDWNQVSKWYVE